MSVKVRCADCVWHYDLYITESGELRNNCKLEKNSYKLHYGTLYRFPCVNGYKYRTKAKMQYKN